MGRKSFNFFDTIYVSTTDFDISVSWSFNSNGIALLIEGTSNITDEIHYSFDGVNQHGSMRPGTASAGLMFDNRQVNKVWFKRAVAGNAVQVRVEAW